MTISLSDLTTFHNWFLLDGSHHLTRSIGVDFFRLHLHRRTHRGNQSIQHCGRLFRSRDLFDYREETAIGISWEICIALRALTLFAGIDFI